MATPAQIQANRLNDEDPDALADLISEYYEEFRPEGPRERYYVDSMIQSDWLRRRLCRSEAELYRALTEGEESDTSLGKAWERDAAGPNALTKIFRQLNALDRDYGRAMNALSELQNDRHGLIDDPTEEDDFELASPAVVSRIQSAAMPLMQPITNTPSPTKIGFVPVGQASLPVHTANRHR